MKRISTVLIALFLVVLMATLYPAQVFADTPDYISEVKIGMGKDGDAAKAALSGYKIIETDLNQNAGGGWGSKGEKVVYLGYKTTKNKDDAITDLALMNMKGGYDINEYDVLMDRQMKDQIVPFVKDFMVAINEYRENLNSKNKVNKQRAAYIREMLNKLTDDDCGGIGLGDLLVNETKFEMGDEAYNKLSDEEKKKHADILTIMAQSQGHATYLMEMMVTKASDTKNNNWVDRFIVTTYDDLINATGQSPTDARKYLAKQYDDDANMILDKWEGFRELLLKKDDAKKELNKLTEDDVKDETDDDDIDFKDSTQEDINNYVADMIDNQVTTASAADSFSSLAMNDFLKSIKYGDGTLLDFFLQSSNEIEEDITVLYPLVASLSDGQRAGLEFVSLADLVQIAETNPEKEYKDTELDKLEPISIYEGVDRTIYQQGGVALTSDSLRSKAAQKILEQNGVSLAKWNVVLISFAAASIAGFIGSFAYKYTKIGILKHLIKSNKAKLTQMKSVHSNLPVDGLAFGKRMQHAIEMGKVEANINKYDEILYKFNGGRNSPLANKLMVGFGVAMVILTTISLILTYKDLKAQYNVQYTPIPHYMIDEKDLVGYNSKGEKIVFKNQSAYYKAVECNRTSNDEMYKSIGTCSDLNGDVGQQWLALYSVKNDVEDPIIAASLKVEINANEVPSGYSTGIHMFGSDSAFNLNSYPYVWNKSAKKIQVFFKRDVGAKANTSGSSFTAGSLAVSGVGGFVIGISATALFMNFKKRKENKAVSV